jgi:ketosteroid isomerase-like protein
MQGYDGMMDDDDAPGGAVEQILAAIEASTELYEAGAQEYFASFTADASFFSSGAPLRIDGRDAFQRYLGPGLAAALRAVHLLDKRIQMLSADAAVVTCYNRFRVNFNFVDTRMTLVMVREGETWKVAHSHASPLLSAASTETHGLTEDVTLLRAAAGADRGPR